MEAIGTNERESANDSESDSLHSCNKETSDLPASAMNSLEENQEDDEAIEENNKEEITKELAACCLRDEQDADDSESMTIINNKIFKKRLKFDAILKKPPSVLISPENENSKMKFEMGQSKVMVNTKALPKEARTYQLEKFRKNCLIIFNQESIDGFEPRLGTHQDVIVLTNTFKRFGFDVVEHKDFTKEKIIEVLESFKTTNFTEYGCVGVVVLTHGYFNGTLRAKDQAYSETEIIKYFRVYDKPTLITKPKLLIIQACRGTKCLPGIQVQRAGTLRKDLDENVEPYTLPAMADMLIVHSSYTGEASTRDEIYGSWFIQTLCTKINEMSSTHDLESILTEVKREVAADRHWEDYNKATGDVEIYKQMPTVTSTLIRKLYLKQFNDESPSITFCDMSTPSTSSAERFLQTVATPMLFQLGPCSCFLDHFDYIKKCLTYFLEENPDDVIGRTFLDISSAFENENQFNAAKERMAKAMCKHLNYHARQCDFFKYIYFYKH